MSEPFIFIGTHRIKEGKAEEFKKSCVGLLEVVEAKEPRLIAFNFYTNEDGTEVSIVQVHPDADSMLFHMQVAREHIEEAVEDLLAETVSVQIYGTPNNAVLEMIRQLSMPGVELSVKPLGLGGFTRSTAEQSLAPS
jgi:quinol monooxygenase YgiN